MIEGISKLEGVMLLVAVFVFLLPWLLCLYDKAMKTSISCKIFGWHNGLGGGQSFDGCSVHGQCSKCGKKVMMDSQGNWF